MTKSSLKRLAHVVSLTVGALCFLSPSTGHADDPIQIGAALTLSPPGPVVFGTQIKEGLDTTLRMINSQGGVIGRQLKMLYEDTQGNPERARSATEKLITRDKVTAMTGIDLTPAVLSSIEVVHQYNVPFANTNGWADTIRQKGYPQVFNPNVYISLAVEATAEFLDGLGAKRVVGIINNDEAGLQQAKGIMAGLEARKSKTKFEPIHIDRMTKDFLPVILPLKANPPDVVLISSQQPAAYIVMKQLYEQGIAPSKTTLLYDQGGVTDSPDYWSSLGEAGRYVVTLGMYHPKVPLSPTGEKFAKLYQQTYNRPPARLALQAADSLLTIAEGIRVAGKTDADSIEAALRDAKFEGTRGEITFDKRPGTTFQQWMSTPYAIYQFTEVNQPIEGSTLISGRNIKADPSKLSWPK